MHQSINKKKIYFYLLILLLLSSTFNFKIISSFNKLNLIKHINIVGLNEKEKKILEKNLKIFLNQNIFLISKDEIEKILKNNSFIDTYEIVKVYPEDLVINVTKTQFVGKTILDGEKFYIGKNGKLTKISLVEKETNLPEVFGNFQVNELLKLQQILKLYNFNLSKIKKYYHFKSNRWDIQFENNTIVMLPSFNLKKSLQNYRSFIKTKKIIPGQLIDLRINDKIIISNYEG